MTEEEAALTAYRAFCNARAGREIPDAELAAVSSRVELEWMHAVVRALANAGPTKGKSNV